MALIPAQLTAYVYGIDPELAGSPPPPTAVSGEMVEWEQVDKYVAAGQLTKVRMPTGKYFQTFYCLTQAVEESDQTPLFVGAYEGVRHWLYSGTAYTSTDPDLTAEDVLALINEAANKRRLRLEKAHALQAMTAQLDSRVRRPSIPQDVKVAVWRRDQGRCTECDSNEALEFDHIIPLGNGWIEHDPQPPVALRDLQQPKRGEPGLIPVSPPTHAFHD